MDIKNLLNDVKGKTIKHSPEILVGVGIAGTCSTVAMAVKTTPKVYSMIEKEKEVRRLEEQPELTKVDIFKMAWKPYLPAALMFSCSTACIIGANSVNAKRNAVLTAACHVSERALAEYRDKVVEVIGEEKEKEIRDKVSKSRMEKDPVTNNTVILAKGETLCYDTISGRYFNSDVDKIKKAENELNHILITGDYCSLNEFYDMLDIPATEMGSAVGWNVKDGLVEIYFSAQIADNGQPCVVMNFDIQPTYNFDSMR